MNKAYRHGEILFLEVKKIPKLKETNTNVIMTGSHGNAHTFQGGKIYHVNEDNFVFGYFEAKGTKLFHPEHGDKKVNGLMISELPDGKYQLRKQVEYINGEMKQVID